MEVTWAEFKKFVDARALSIQFVEIGANYFLRAIDGAFSIDCIIPIDPEHEATAVFNAGYKAKANITPSQTASASAAKFLGSKNLFKRVIGVKNEVDIGETTILWAMPFPWAKFIGVEIMGGDIGDTCSFYVLDSVTGTYSGFANAQLNQFGYNCNVAKDFYLQRSEFDADIYLGMQIKIVYTSASVQTIGINFIMNEVK